MSYDRKKRFVLGFLAHGQWRYGAEIVEASRGQLLKSTAYVTLERMEGEQLIQSMGKERDGLPLTATEKQYRKR